MPPEPEPVAVSFTMWVGLVVAELTRERDSARDIAVRCGAFDGSAGTDFPAHLDRTWEMAPVDPEGQAFK